MFSLCDDGDFKFDVGSSPLSMPDMRISETDFQLACKSPINPRIADFSNLDQDLFNDFMRFDDTLPNIFEGRSHEENIFGGTRGSPSQNFDFSLQKAPFLPEISKDPFLSSKEIDFFASPTSSDSSMASSPTLGHPLESCCSQPDLEAFQNPKSKSSKRSFVLQNRDIPSKIKDVKSASSSGRSKKLFKGQKLQRKCEVFQPFASLTRLESTVHELRKIMCDQASSQ